MKYYYLYKITNLLNDMIYIGVHSTNNIDDDYFGSGKLLNYAIKKYGKENFKKEILEYFETAEQMFEREKNLVDLEFVKNSMTYNIKEGGCGNSSNDSKKLWENPNYRKSVIEKSLSKFWNDPFHKAKLQEIYQSEEYKNKLKIATKISANDPNKKKRTSETSKERWSNLAYRENMSNKTRDFMSNSKFIHNDELQKNKRVRIDELAYYIESGWKLGMNLSFRKHKKKRLEEQ